MKATYNQADFLKETSKTFGRGSEAYHDALNAQKVSKVSFSKEFEEFRQLPKFSHVPLAVIHPSPIKRLANPKRPDPDFEIEASPTKLLNRPGKRYEVPDSLQRPPGMEPTTVKKSRPKTASLGFGSSQPRFGAKNASKKSKLNWAEKME